MTSFLADPRRFPRIAGGLSLILAPLAFFVGTLIHPGLRDNAGEQLALISEHPTAWYVTHLLGLVFVALAVPAVLALAHLLRRTQPALAHLGATAALLGLSGWAGVVAIFGWVGWQAAREGDPAQMTGIFERVTEQAATAIPTRMLSFAAVAGLVLLAIGLVRAPTTPRLAGPLLGMGVGQFALGAQSGTKGLMIAGTALMTLGMGSVGLSLLRSSDREWALGRENGGAAARGVARPQ